MKTWSIAPLFVQPIASTEIDKDVCEKIKEFSEDQFWFADDRSLAYGSAMSKDMQVLNKHAEVRSYLKQVADDLITQLGYDCDTQITTSWLSKVNPGGEIPGKTIYNSWYTSIVFFDEYDEKCGDTEFYVDPQGIHVVPDQWNHWTAPFISLTPAPAHMMMFPSYVKHRVLRNETEDDRMCLMFNIMPKGLTGSSESTYSY